MSETKKKMIEEGMLCAEPGCGDYISGVPVGLKQTCKMCEKDKRDKKKIDKKN